MEMTRTTVRGWMLALGMAAVFGLNALGHAQAAVNPACTLKGKLWVCNRAMFHQAVREARTVNIDVSPRDRNGRMQMRKLAEELGKTVVEGPADLTFVLVPVSPEVISIGPAGRDLAILSVYAPGPEGAHGPLVWSETFSGAADMRWPEVVYAAIRQFKGALEKR